MITHPTQIQLGSPYDVAEYKDFAGGLSTASLSHLIEPNQVADVLNLKIDRAAKIWKKRKGFSRNNSSAISANAIFGLFRYYGSTKFILTATGTDIYKDNGAGVYSSIKTGLANNTNVYFDAMEISGTLNAISVNGNNQNPQKWAGSGSMADLGGTPPKGLNLIVHKNYLWLWHATAAQRVTYSDVSDPETWPANNFFNLKTKGAGAGVGFAILDDTLICFKEDSIHRIVGASNDDFRVEIISASIGCASARSIAYTADAVYFLGNDNVIYKLTGNSLMPISVPVTRTLENIPASQRNQTAGAIYDNYYMFSYARPGQTTNDRVLLFDILLGVWAGLYDWAVNCFSVWTGTGDTSQLYGGQSNNGFILYLDTGTKDVATTITTIIQYRYEGQGSYVYRKRYAWAILAIQPFTGTLKVDFILDYDTIVIALANQSVLSGVGVWGTGLWGTAKWGGQSFAKYAYRIPVPNKGYIASLKLTNTDSDDELAFYGYGYGYQLQQMRIS